MTEHNLDNDATETIDAAEIENTGVDTENSEIPDAPEPQSKREARYRTQLRETEAQRDQLNEVVNSMRRREIERLAAAIIAKPESLWATEATVADLLDDDGLVDASKVEAAAHHAQQTLGLELGKELRKLRQPVVPREGGTTLGGRLGKPWADAFK